MQAHHCQKVITTYFAELKREWVDDAKISPEWDMHSLKANAEIDYQYMAQAALHGDVYKRDHQKLQRIVDNMRLPRMEVGSADFLHLAGQMRVAEVEAQRIYIAKLSGASLNEQQPTGQFAVSALPTMIESLSEPRFIPPSTAPRNLDDLITRYCEEKVRAGAWREGKVAKGNERKLRLFAQTVGTDKAPHEVSYDDVARYRDLVWQLPQNFGKGRDNFGESIEQAVQRNAKGNGARVSNKTIQQHFLTVQSLFKTSRKLRYVPEDLTEGLLSLTVKSDEALKRPAMKPEHVQKLLDSDIFKKSSVDDKWLAMLGMYTGAREGELVNLKVKDIKRSGGISYIDLPYMRDGRKAAKNTQSKRKVPIHNDLKALGFEEYVADMAKRGEEWLFPAAIYYEPQMVRRTKRPDPTDAFGKRFAYMMQCAGLRDDEVVEEGMSRLCFHSLRHAFKDATLNSDIEERYAMALMGHSSSTVHSKYGSGFPIEKLAAAMSRIDFGLKIPRSVFSR